MKQAVRSRRRLGFTLIEMVLVLIILATIAGLVISQISMLGRTSDMAATAKNQQDIANQLGLYFVLQKRMPQRLDSLLEAGATAGDPPVGVLQARDGAGAATASSLDQRRGFPLNGANGVVLPKDGTDVNLVMATVTGQNRRSFTRLGFDFLMDHDATVANSNNSGTRERAVSGDFAAATVVEGKPLARQLYPLPTAAFPDGGDFPADVGVVVAVGIGPACSLIPNTMLNAPAYPGSDGAYYGRYIAYFACFNNGERAQLVGVSDSYGRFPNYSIQQFNESLPNNGRQG